MERSSEHCLLGCSKCATYLFLKRIFRLRFPTLAGTAEQTGYTIKGTNLVSGAAFQQYYKMMVILLFLLLEVKILKSYHTLLKEVCIGKYILPLGSDRYKTKPKRGLKLSNFLWAQRKLNPMYELYQSCF